VSTFSLVRGGPLYRLLQRMRIVRGDSRDVLRQALLWSGLAWLPLVALQLVREGGISQYAILRDLAVHVRLLVAIPLFAVAEEVLHRTCARAVSWWTTGQFVVASPGDPDRVEEILAKTERRRDAVGAELLLAGFAWGAQVVTWLVTGRAGLLSAFMEGGLPPDQAWYAFVALPLFNFLWLRLLYRWLLWSGLLWRFSHLELRLVPTHPDLAAGLAQLAEPAVGFAVVLLANSAMIAAAWYSRMAGTEIKISAYASEFLLLAALGEALALGPLVLFSRQLLRARLEGLYQYRKLALSYTRLFHRRWIEQGDETELLGTPDLQSLADLGNSYQIVDKMRIVPFGPRDALIVFAAVAVPVLPLVLMEVPLPKLLGRVGKMLLG
jgi:hypothetical protein